MRQKILILIKKITTKINLKLQYGTSLPNTLFYEKTGYQDATSKEEVCAVKQYALEPYPWIPLTEDEKKKKVRLFLCTVFKNCVKG